jgi:hypothetical protein
MKLKCLHGFYLFEELKPGQVSDFSSLTGFELVPFGTKFTFAELQDIENYSLIGKSIGTFPATKTFAGEPWEVFEANNLVFNFASGLIVPIQTITSRAIIEQAGNRYISPGLLLAGSFTNTAQRVKSYTAHYSRDTQRWLYSEIDYV